MVRKAIECRWRSRLSRCGEVRVGCGREPPNDDRQERSVGKIRGCSGCPSEVAGASTARGQTLKLEEKR